MTWWPSASWETQQFLGRSDSGGLCLLLPGWFFRGSLFHWLLDHGSLRTSRGLLAGGWFLGNLFTGNLKELEASVLLRCTNVPFSTPLIRALRMKIVSLATSAV